MEGAVEAELPAGPGEARLPMVEAEEVKFSVEEPSVGILPVGAAARTEVNKIFSVGIPCLSYSCM